MMTSELIRILWNWGQNHYYIVLIKTISMVPWNK